MFFNKKQQRLVGAAEKLRHAQQLKGGYLKEQITSKGEGKNAGPLAAVLLVYFIACALAYVLTTEGILKSGFPFRTGFSAIDGLLAGTDLVAIAARGFVFFLMGGVIPLLTFFWVRLIDRKQDYIFVTFWGVTVGAPLVFLLVVAYVVPLLIELFDIFFG
jgi:hypothetical protein